MEAKNMTDAQLVDECIRLDQEQAEGRKQLNAYKAELQARGAVRMEDQNIKYVKFYAADGLAAVTDSQSLDILNPDKLKNLIGEGVYKTKISENVKTDYKCDKKLEKALKAIFTQDYTFEMTMEEFLDEMSIKPDGKQKAVLLKKLKGEYEPDRKLLEAVFETTQDFDVELYFIYKIKNGELIKAFLPEEGLDYTMAEIKKAILVEGKTSITLDYKKEDK